MFNILKMARKLKCDMKNILKHDTGVLSKIFNGTIYGLKVIERIDNKPVTRIDLVERGIYCIHCIANNTIKRVSLTKFNRDMLGTIVVYDDMIYTIQHAEYDYELCKIMVDIVYIGNANINHRVNVEDLYTPSNFIERYRLARELYKLNIVL